MIEDSIRLVKFFDAMGKNIREITCQENVYELDLWITTNDGKRYLLNIDDIHCVTFYEECGEDS